MNTELNIRRKLMIILGIIILGLFPDIYCEANQGKILRVPSEYATIQAAVDSATSGDKILVAPGIYTGGTKINKESIRLISDNQYLAIIESATSDQWSGFRLMQEAENVAFQGFCFRKKAGIALGYYFPEQPNLYGLEIFSCLFEDGSMISIRDINNSTFSHNIIRGVHGAYRQETTPPSNYVLTPGIWLSSCNNCLVYNNVIYDIKGGDVGDEPEEYLKTPTPNSGASQSHNEFSRFSSGGPPPIQTINGGHGVGIYVEASMGCKLYNNTIVKIRGGNALSYGCYVGGDANGIRVERSGDIYAANNIIYDCSGGRNLNTPACITGTMPPEFGFGLGIGIVYYHYPAESFVKNVIHNLAYKCSTSAYAYISDYEPRPPLPLTNLFAEPKFTAIEKEDFRLQSSSPCIDSGTMVTGLMDDIEGNPRPIGKGYDMGAYEYMQLPDFNNDGRVDSKDLFIMKEQWYTPTATPKSKENTN